MKRTLMTLAAVVLTAALGGYSVVAQTPAQDHANHDSNQASVSEQTATFNVENMTCAMCPITVRTAMEKVNGVKSVVVDYDTKTATVIFNPAIATPAQIAAASANAGYPANPAS